MVSGSVPISEKIITLEDNRYVWKDGDDIDQKKKYALCRCGRTNRSPFCDGTHSKGVPFEGKERSDTEPHRVISETPKGKNIGINNDGLCALDRFYHIDEGDIDTLNSDHPEDEFAPVATNECSIEKQTTYNKYGPRYGGKLEPEIIVIQDLENDCSGGYYVKGGIKLISSNGKEYEAHNRYVLCRCGASRDMPFCDMGHISRSFKNKKE